MADDGSATNSEIKKGTGTFLNKKGSGAFFGQLTTKKAPDPFLQKKVPVPFFGARNATTQIVIDLSASDAPD